MNTKEIIPRSNIRVKPKRGKTYSAYNVPPQIKCKFHLEEDGTTSPGRTKQSFKEEADINNIVKRHGLDKIRAITSNIKAEYGDYTTINEYQESLDLVNRSRENFAQLPSEIRTRFGNNPGLFNEFVTNPENAEELYKLGLAKRPLETPKDEPIEVINVTPEEKTEESTK